MTTSYLMIAFATCDPLSQPVFQLYEQSLEISKRRKRYDKIALRENVAGNRQRLLSQLDNVTNMRTPCELCSNNMYIVQLIGDWFRSAQLHILNQQ